jgi:transcriptional regulator with XRE-family HTH domain
MSKPIDMLLSEFIDAWNAGERPLVTEFLQRAAPAEREELGERIEDWLLVAPTPAYGEQALADIRHDPALVGTLAAIRAEPGLWPDLLPRLRERAGLKRRELAGRITSAFGLKGQEQRAERYLERMEQGELDTSLVSRRLLDTLGSVLGISGADLVRAGTLRPAAPAPGQALFRAGREPGEFFEEDLEALSRAAMAPAPPPMDELDRLFVGGPDA